MIERLVIHRFRGIREGSVEDMGRINLLIGPNNSGKTAILEMLYLAGTSGRKVSLILDDVPLKEGEEAVFKATTTVREDFSKLPPFPRLRQRHGLKKEVSLSAMLTEEGEIDFNFGELSDYGGPIRRFRLSPPLGTWGMEDKRRFREEDLKQVALFTIVPGQEGIPRAITPALFFATEAKAEAYRWHYLYDPSWVHRWARSEPVDELAVWAETGMSPRPEHVLFFDFHLTNAHFPQKFAQWAKNQPWDWADLIAGQIAEVFPSLKGAKVEIDDAPEGQKGEAGYIRLAGKGRLPIDHLGDGARHAFKVLAYLTALSQVVTEEKPGLFLWEDPELFMHPISLSRLLNVVVNLVLRNHIQVFITTQSLEVLAWLIEALEEALSSTDVCTFYLELKEGSLETTTFHGKEISGWMEFIGDPRILGQEEMGSPLIRLFTKGREKV